MPREEIERLEKALRPVRVAQGETFLRQGRQETKFGFVEEGLFRFLYLQEDGSEATRAFVMEGGFLAVRVSLTRDEIAPFSIEALEDSSVLVSTRSSAFFRAPSPHWAAFTAALCESRLDYKDRRIKGFLTKDAAGRYLDFLDEYPGVEDRVKQHHIASYLGVTPVTLSRVRARLRRDGRLRG
jgi:CRP-like cAMP-binding protein